MMNWQPTSIMTRYGRFTSELMNFDNNETDLTNILTGESASQMVDFSEMLFLTF